MFAVVEGMLCKSDEPSIIIISSSSSSHLSVFSHLSAYASTQPHAYAYGGAAGCPAGGRFPPGECFMALGFALLPVSYSLQSRQPDPRTPDEYTPRQYWSANFIKPHF